MTGSQHALRRRRQRSGRARVMVGGRRKRAAAIAGGVLLFIIASGATAVGATALYGIARYDSFVREVAPPGELLAKLPRGGARIYDRHGTLLYEFVDELAGLRRPVLIAKISPWAVDATIATEDASFWDNSGLNVRGLARAGWENFSPFNDQDILTGSGGSSITQQLAKNVYIPREERTERSVERKLKEAAIALELTNRYPKEQILEWYLNSISYGGIYVGIEAASEGYFGKSASELRLSEAALLAGIPQQPARYDPFNNPVEAKARQSEVLDLMVRHGFISQDEADRARDEDIQLRQARFDIEAPHWVLGKVAKEIEQRFGPRALYQDGLEVTTTLDLELQRTAHDVLESWIREYENSSGGHNGAFYALDAATGQILVYIGSRDYFRDDIQGRNDNVVSLNSPGSTLKPFTYMTAFMRGWSTGTGVLDVPTQVMDPSTGQYFTPRNPGTPFQGIIAADKALGNSLNIPALQTIIFAGVPETLRVLKSVGFTTFNNPGGYGPALTLGGADVSLEDLTFAYSVLANQGALRGEEALVRHGPGERTIDPAPLLKVVDPDGKVLYEYTEPAVHDVVGANYAYLATSILSNGQNQCITFGACGALELAGRPSAKKTGTSEPFADDSRQIGETWAVGYTPQLVAGVWFGNADNAPMDNIISTSVSWRAWRDFMTQAHEQLDLAATPFTRPPGVVERELCWPSGKLPSDVCPKDGRYTGLFAAETLERPTPDMTDHWWQRVKIDTRNGLLAGSSTPSQFVSEEVRLVVPEKEVGGWTGFSEWVSKSGLGGKIAPTVDSSTVGAYVQLVSPTSGQKLSGQVTVVGRAASPDFKRWDLEYARASDRDTWNRISGSDKPIDGGEIGKWDTSKLPAGGYVLRLLVEDAKLGNLRFEVAVSVNSSGGSGSNSDDAEVVAQIRTPIPGAVVENNLRIRGTADGPSMTGYVVEVGGGLSPTSWDRIKAAENDVKDGDLATWDTRKVPDGIYSIRLTVVDSKLGPKTSIVVLTVKNK